MFTSCEDFAAVRGKIQPLTLHNMQELLVRMGSGQETLAASSLCACQAADSVTFAAWPSRSRGNSNRRQDKDGRPSEPPVTSIVLVAQRGAHRSAVIGRETSMVDRTLLSAATVHSGLRRTGSRTQRRAAQRSTRRYGWSRRAV